jgi:hypothetical protein
MLFGVCLPVRRLLVFPELSKLLLSFTFLELQPEVISAQIYGRIDFDMFQMSPN